MRKQKAFLAASLVLLLLGISAWQCGGAERLEEPTPQAVATAQLRLGESGVYEGMTVTLVKYELTDTRIEVLGTNIPAEVGHHWLWLYARAENRGSKPAFRPIPLLFDVWHKGREVASICQEPYEGDPHQPSFNCGPYMKMQPGESCEGWLYVAPGLRDDWALEDLVVSYGDMCDSESRPWTPCLYWRLE